MAWGELRAIPYEYNDKAQEIDEQLVSLLTARRSIARGKRLFPSPEVIEAWSKQYNLEVSVIHLFLHSLMGPVRSVSWQEPGELRHVLSIMKKTVVNQCLYTLTHAMQHEHLSIVFLEIEYLHSTEEDVYIKPNLTLEVVGKDEVYQVSRTGNGGSNFHTKMQFSISPPLPERLDDLAFSLVPAALFMEDRRKEIILDQQVDF